MSSETIYSITHPDFTDNKYFHLYLKICSSVDTDCYTENHHILPRSLGGSNLKSNLIRLSARKHFLAHYLLTKFTKPKSEAWYSMVKAFNMMNCQPTKENQRYLNSRLYESNRNHMSMVMSMIQTGSRNSQFGKVWIHHPYTKHYTRINSNENIPDGYKLGSLPKYSGFQLYIIRESKIQKAVQEHRKTIDELMRLHEIYITKGFIGVFETGYNKSQQNLVAKFARHLTNFVPQNGKPRCRPAD